MWFEYQHHKKSKNMFKCHKKTNKPKNNNKKMPREIPIFCPKLNDSWLIVLKYSPAVQRCFLWVCQRHLRVHSVSGVLRLIWMLSIQMCPLVPCAKKPSITTYRGVTEAGRRRKKSEGGEANKDRGQG